MKAGKLNRLVTVTRHMQTGTDPDYNTPIYGDVIWAKFWAAIVPKSEEERYAAGQIYNAVTVTFRAHFIDGLLTTDVLACEGKSYNVLGVRELGYRAGLEITAKLSE